MAGTPAGRGVCEGTPPTHKVVARLVKDFSVLEGKGRKEGGGDGGGVGERINNKWSSQLKHIFDWWIKTVFYRCPDDLYTVKSQCRL